MYMIIAAQRLSDVQNYFIDLSRDQLQMCKQLYDWRNKLLQNKVCIYQRFNVS